MMLDLRRLGLAGLAGICLLTPVIVLTGGGTTAAEFAVSHTLGENVLTTATLDIELGQSVVEVEQAVLAPGDSRQLEFWVRNSGELPLLFTFLVAPNSSLLSDVLTWKQTTGPCGSPPSDSSTGREPLALAVGEQTAACLKVSLSLDAPNDLQGTEALFDVVVDAVHDIDRRSDLEDE